MGYAKYSEDIIRTHSQNVFGTFLDYQFGNPSPRLCCTLCTFQTDNKTKLEEHVIKSHRDAAIFLEYDDHIIEDSAVFRVRPIHLKIRCPALPDGVSIEVRSSRKAIPPTTYTDGQLLKITPPDEDVVRVQITVGAYRRSFGISFKHQLFHARLTEALLDVLQRANGEIHSWTWPQVHAFEQYLEKENDLTSGEKEHRRAIYQYYLGLWMEQGQRTEYSRHYEEAYQVLRNFSDPLAQLVSSYFLYRTNCFQAISPMIPFPQLRQVVSFFDPTRDLDEMGFIPAGGTDDEYVPCEISITEGDAHLFDAVRAFNERRFKDSLMACDGAENKILPFDEQARQRLCMVRFRNCRELGDDRGSRFFAERLVGSSSPFKTEVEQFLRLKI